MAKFELPAGMAFDVDGLKAMVDELERRFEPLFTRVGWRNEHFHNLESVNPQLPPPFDNGPKYQTDLPRRIHTQLKARVVENHFRVAIEPIHDTAAQRKPASLVQEYFNEGFRLLEERQGFGIQDALADGQIISCYGIVHWRKADDVWPEIPELEYLEATDDGVAPEGFEPLYADDEGETSERYVIGDDGFPVYGEDGQPTTRPLSRYRESEASRTKRYVKNCASAGFPWVVEYPHPTEVMWANDRSLEAQPAVVVWRKQVPLLPYVDALNAERKKDDRTGSLHDADADIPIFGEPSAPKSDFIAYPSDANYLTTLTVYQFWTREEFYEIADGNGFAWEVVKADKHPYGMCPFAIAPAQRFQNPDPLLAFEPALEGVYRIKPLFDLQMSHQLVIGQQIALPYYYWASVRDGSPMLDERGNVMTFTRDAASAEVGPEGYELKKLDFDLNPAFVQSTQQLREDMERAAPDTGQAEFTTSTQPWAIRLQQAQKNVSPGRIVAAHALAILTMARNMLHVQSMPEEDGGFGRMHLYARHKDGKVDPTTTVTLDPEDIQSLKLSVDITAQSGAERITIEEHGRQLYKDGLITIDRYYRDYLAIENPDEAVLDLDATKLYRATVMPQIANAALMEEFGNWFTMAPNGQFLDFRGQPVSAEQVLMANGQQPTMPQAPQAANQPSQPTNSGGGGGMDATNRGALRPQMPGMGAMAVPGTIPVGGPPA